VQRRTRLAPSPTGALHLGNARTFVATWAIAHQNGWSITLRVEDIDGPRVKPAATQQALDDLAWLGLNFDDGPIIQSTRTAAHKAAIEHLVATNAVYACVCSRKEIETAASAPHAEDGGAIYPGTCRDRFTTIVPGDRAAAWRFRVPNEPFSFVDQFAGPRSFDLEKQIGDFVVAKADRSPAYQLAVVVDDLAAGVTDVIRGDDLLDSVPRQTLLYRALGQADAVPRYWHLPLVLGLDGRRLAKRHGDTRLSTYRAAGVPAERVLAWVARTFGLQTGDYITAREIAERFDVEKVPREPVRFGTDEDRWLRTS
jgi:glutamyl-tRNA synthetase